MEVDPAFAGLPVLDVLSILWPERSKEGLRALFARGKVQVAGQPVSPAREAAAGMVLEVRAELQEIPSIHLAAEEQSSGVKLLHEDPRIAVLAKPAGVPVIPDRSRAGPSCLGFLIRRELSAREGLPAAGWRRPRVVHRIDRLTSGVVVFARTLADEVQLAGMFERGKVRKEYLALLSGEVAPARVAVNVPVGPGRKGRMRAAPDGKPSLTEFQVLGRFRGFTLVRAVPRTGRTHQIRVHAWALGHPLAVDPLYRVGPFAALPPPPAIQRLTLHAERIALPLDWGEPREFHAEPPEDFQAALGKLGTAPSCYKSNSAW